MTPALAYWLPVGIVLATLVLGVFINGMADSETIFCILLLAFVPIINALMALCICGLIIFLLIMAFFEGIAWLGRALFR